MAGIPKDVIVNAFNRWNQGEFGENPGDVFDAEECFVDAAQWSEQFCWDARRVAPEPNTSYLVYVYDAELGISVWDHALSVFDEEDDGPSKCEPVWIFERTQALMRDCPFYRPQPPAPVGNQ